MKSNLVKLGITTILGSVILPVGIFASSIINVDSISYQLSDGQEAISLKANSGETVNKEILVTNNSNQKLNLTLRNEDAEQKSASFKISTDTSSDLKSWIHLSRNEISIAPHQTEKVEATIIIPSSAGVGKHYGAILGKYEFKDDQNVKINLENGMRITVDINGKAINDFKLINPVIKESSNTVNYTGKLFNSGNTLLKGQVVLNGKSQEISIQPQDATNFSLNVPKSDKYLSSVKLNELSKAYLLNPSNQDNGSNFLLILGTIALVFIAINRAKKLSPEKTGFILLCLISIGLVSELTKPSDLKTDLISQNDTTYLTTIKFGNFPERQISKNGKTQWNGTFQTNGGKMFIVQKLHNEPSDQIYLNQDGNTLYFNNITGPDNDGVIVLVKADSSESKPQLRYHNSLSGKDQNIDLEKTLNHPIDISYKNFGVEIASETPGPTVTAYVNGKAYSLQTIETLSETINEGVSTEEIESISDQSASAENESISEGTATPDERIETPTIPSDQLKNELNLLQEIISEIPASSEILTDYILNSDHVEEVTYNSNVTTVKADESLINTLKETPLTIDKLTDSSEINFVFTPNEKINLTPQQFSFTETRISSQQLGEIVLVQNRQSNWATSISISDFESLSGGANISANNVVINPGKIKLISQEGNPAEITAGQEYSFTGSNDQATLVSIIPNGNEKTIFSIQPTLSVRVPAGTPPGRYKANITIRVL